MAKTTLLIFGLWLLTVSIYIGLAMVMPIAVSVMNTSVTTTGGAEDMVKSSPVWAWFVPGLACTVITTVLLTRREGV